MKTRIEIKNLRIALLGLFLILFSTFGYSQACSGNSVTVSLSNITNIPQTSTIEFDVNIVNNSANTIKLASLSGALFHNAGFAASGVFTCISQPSANDFPTLNNVASAAYSPASSQLRWTNNPVLEPAAVLLPTGVVKRFARFRFVRSATAFPLNFPATLTFAEYVQPGVTVVNPVVYCNGNASSTALANGSAPINNGFLIIGGPYNFVVNPGEVCATSGAAVVTPETCAAAANGTATITMSPVPSNLSATYVLDGGTSASVTLSASGAFTLTGLSGGPHTLAVTGSGTCTTAISVPFTITTNPTLTPTFSQVPDICSGGTLAPLPTTSTNGVTGTWAPALDNTATTTYTFTPAIGQCATTTTMTITVNPSVTPTFTQVSPICSGDVLTALPTTSTNGIIGTWAPALNNTATTTYTFTPSSGPCNTTATMTITVNQPVVPTFTQVAPICNGGTLTPLPTTSNNAFTGTWSPALDNTTTTTYTFTPTAGQCAATATMTITVNPLTTNGSVTTTACGSYTWPANGVTYTTSQSGLTFVSGCNTATLNLTITAIDYANLQFPDTATLCQGQTFTAYGRVYEAGITDASQTLQGAGIDVEFGLSAAGGSADPSTWTNWSAATYNSSSLCYPCNDDEYQFTAGALLTPGTYYYTFRYKLTACTTWQYGGYPNGFWNGTTQNSGLLTVNALTTNGSVTTTACNSYTWPANGVTYTTSQTNLTHVVGCNTATLNLTINNSTSGTTTATACNTYTWAAPLGNGLTYTTSQTGITFVSTNAAGCPNTQTLNLTINNSTSGTTNVNACDTYTWAGPLGNGVTYTTSQTGITFVSTNAAGCPNTQTLNLTINNSTTGTTTATACNTYTWALPLGNGLTYTTSQTGITNVTTNAAGCPHTQTLNLTINNSTTGTTTATACDTYTWAPPLGNGLTYTTSQTGITHVSTNAAGCPNTQTLNLTINNSTNGTTTATACNSYTWALPLGNGQTYTTSQTGITNVTTNAAGCNHTQTLNLTLTTAATPTGNAVQTFPVFNLNDATIASIVVSPAAVIWYGSLANAQAGVNPLPSTTVLTSGSTYWAVNVVGTCASTPFAVTVTVTLGNNEFDSLNFSYSPNPTSSLLNISYSKAITEIQVTNMLGQVIMTKKTNDVDVQIDMSAFAAATYFVKVTAEDQSKIVKVIKKD